jgi:8-oxo-dGTP diphosphatase
MEEFVGVKIALLTPDEKLVVYLRDDKPEIKFPGLWDFPGGGREDNETPTECILREVEEEFGISLTEGNIIFSRAFPAMHDETKTGYFMVGRISQKDLDSIRFGSEGAGSIATYLTSDT